MRNWDVAGAPKGDVTFHDFSRAEGLGFNLCVVPADSLSPSIS